MSLDNEQAKNLEDTLQLPCPSCGSELHYSAEHQKIACEYCGYLEDIDRSQDKIVEQSLAEAASKIQAFIPEESGKKVFECGNCGSRFMVESERLKVSCGFCGSVNVNLEAYQHQYIKPVGIIPFYISRAEAEKLFAKWIKGGWFHPNKLKNVAQLDQLHGIYIPFWTYDAQTESRWSGEAGYYYYETETVYVDGKEEQRRVQKTRWRRHSGNLSHFFDDILVVASHGLNQQKIQKVFPFRLQEMVNYDPRLMVNWEAELYDLEVDKGYKVADRIMDNRIRQMCSAQLGGDTQRNLNISSNKQNQTFKHVVLPLWICSYMYQNKVYHFFINGQTGKVRGDKPISWVKIAFVILLFALFILGVFLLKESGVLQQQ